MALVSQSIKNLKGGVSQQPDILRYPEQGEAQINGWSSDTDGIQKRPPAVFIKKLGGTKYLGDKPLIHLINRDASEKYYVAFTGSTIKAFSLTGEELKVTGDMTYATTPSPRDDLRMVTVADYTFVINKNVKVDRRPDRNYDDKYRPNGRAIINVRGGQYGRKLSFAINGTWTDELELPSGSGENAANDVKKTDAQYIAGELSRLGSAKFPNYKFIVGSGYVLVEAPEGSSISSIDTKDGYANQLINAFIHEVQNFTKLPAQAPKDYLVRVAGEAGKGQDAYYVRYDIGTSTWKETVGWDTYKGWDSKTMPHALRREADGSFVFIPIEWNDRVAGDADTCPFPSLLGATINDVFFYRNRLGFLSGENVVMSRTGKFFNLWPSSVATLNDDDPIDVAISHNRISVLKFAVPFSEELLLWSDQAQFVLTAAGTLTSKSIELNLTTEFDVTDSARPFGIGRGIYFAAPRSNFTSIKRYYAIQDVSTAKSAEDISAHIPRYVPNGVFSIHGSGTENFVSLLTEGAENRIYIYKFLYVDEVVKQQAWSYFEFDKNVRVLSAASIGSTTYLLCDNGSGVYLERMDFTKVTVDYPDEPFRIFVDHKVRVKIPASAYDDLTYKTTFNIAEFYGMSFKGLDVLAVDDDGMAYRFVDTDVLEWEGDVSERWFTIGTVIKWKYVFSKLLIKKTADDGSVQTEDIGRLQLRRAWVNYENSGAFRVEVDNGSRVFYYEMGGGRLSSRELVIKTPNVDNGQFRFPIAGNAKNNTVTILSDHPTPLSIIGCGWEGNYMRRTTGM